MASETRLGDFATLRKGVSYKGEYLDRGDLRLLGLGTVVPGGGLRPVAARSYAGPVKDHQRLRPGELFIALTDITQAGRVLGSPALLSADEADCYAVTHHVARVEIRRPDRLDTRYLYYLLQSDSARAYFRGVATGTTVRAVSPRDAEALPVDLPPLPEQRRIAHILGTLDDKIELNRRMNETLEEMARALFKSWFVDFDPVRAKAEGRDPGLPEHLADLFPDRLVDSELGEIPEGWVVSVMGDHVECVKGRSYKSSELAASDTALVTLKSFFRGGGYRPDGLKAYTGPYKPSQVVRPGDLVVAATDVTQAAEVVSKPALVETNGRFLTLVASLDVIVVRPRSDDLSKTFLYWLFRSDSFAQHARGHSTGTTVLHLSAQAVPRYEFARPPRAFVEAFSQLAETARASQDSRLAQSRALAAARESLLPKLMRAVPVTGR